jgi:hypothetical protein
MSFAATVRPTPLQKFLVEDLYNAVGERVGGNEPGGVAARSRYAWRQYFDPVAVTRRNQILEESFRKLADEWLEKIAFEASLSVMTKLPPYRAIIELGEDAVPLLLRELESRPNFWFAALREITKADPVPEKDKGHLGKMTQAWLRWAKEQRISW